jgi:GNAT superfamily N-acetyltransferase
MFKIQQLDGYPGCFVLHGGDTRLPAPQGFIWFRYPFLNVVELLYIFVHEDFRRIGVATMMLEHLKEFNPGHTIAGAKVNEASRLWCLKNGFVNTENGWFLYPKGD